MDQRRIGGARTTKKTMIRPLGMSAKRWKILKKKRTLKRRGSRKLRTVAPLTLYGKSNMMSNNNIGFGKTNRRGKSLSKRQLKNMAINFRKTLKVLKKQEKSKLTRIAEEAEISVDELENHINYIVHDKLSKYADDEIPADDNIRMIATAGLDYELEATNPDYSDAKQKRFQKKFRDSLKKIFILEKTYEGGNAYFGKEQGTIAYHEFMQEALHDRIHEERPNIAKDHLANILDRLAL